MKVTLIGTLPPIKALSPYCFHLAQALSKKIDLQFINFINTLPNFLYKGGMKENTSYSLKNFEINSILSLYNPLSWIKAGLKIDGKIVHLQHWALYSSIVYCFLSPIIKIRGKKCVVSIHNITPHRNDFFTIILDRILNKIIFSFSDIFIVHNERNKNKLLKIYKLDEKKIFIIPHGTLYPYQKIKGISKKEARSYLNIQMNKKEILFFGYMWDYKGLEYLLKALKKVTFRINNVVLVIAGQPLKDWKKYEEIIKQNDLDKYIIKKLEYIPDAELEYYFNSSDLVLLPYKQHRFNTHGGVGALALSFKKPLIVTDVGGLPEYVKDKRVIANPDDPDDLSLKIINVLTNEDLLKKLAEDSEKLSRELSWDIIADNTIEIYRKL